MFVFAMSFKITKTVGDLKFRVIPAYIKFMIKKSKNFKRKVGILCKMLENKTTTGTTFLNW